MMIDVLYQAPNIKIITPQNILNDGLSFYKKHQDKKWILVNCLSFVIMQEVVEVYKLNS